MRHMGISGKFALITAVAALGMLVLTAITLEEAVMATFLGLVALAYVAAVADVVLRRRNLALLATGVGTSLTVAFFLAFVSTWELAFVDQSTIVGTPLPTDDPDNYFFWAAASAVATVLVLFLGVVWPSGKRLGAGGRLPAGGRGGRGGAQRASGSRAPARLPAGARVPVPAKRTSSSASPVRNPALKPAPKSGTNSASRR